MDAVKTFWLEPTGRYRAYLRVYCPCGGETQRVVGEFEGNPVESPAPEWDSIIWPANCDQCHQPLHFDLDGDDPRHCTQVVGRPPLYTTPTGQVVALNEAEPGAMWDATWRGPKGSDGRCLTVRLPDGHDWCIDSRASNCTMPDDTEHRCWVRHGEPPEITVNKDGLTCGAGGGSIQTANWHGFLTAGELVSC